MNSCPNCNAEVEADFEICWNCNYSFIEKKTIDFGDETPLRLRRENKKIDCLRCKVPLTFHGNYKFHEGSRTGAWGDLFELLVNRESFDLYICPQCDKVEFYAPPK